MTTAIVDSTDIEICVDCLMFIANGDVPEDGDNSNKWSPKNIEQQWPTVCDDETCDSHGAVHGTLHRDIALGDGECGFSWRRCEGCGSHLGGDRHKATVLVTQQR